MQLISDKFSVKSNYRVFALIKHIIFAAYNFSLYTIDIT